MSRLHAKAAAVYVDEFDFRGVSNAVTLDFSNNLAPVTAYADTDETYVEGKAGYTCAVKGLYSISSPDYDGEMFTDLTAASRRLGIFPGGPPAGNYGYELVTNITASPRKAATGSVVALDVSWRGNTPAARGPLLLVNTAVAASGNGTAYNMGAVGATQTLVGVIRLLAAPGGAGNNTLDVIVQSDALESFLSPATVLTFTQLDQASVATFEVQTQAGALTDSWWRVSYTYAGAGTRTFSLVVSLGIRLT